MRTLLLVGSDRLDTIALSVAWSGIQNSQFLHCITSKLIKKAWRFEDNLGPLSFVLAFLSVSSISVQLHTLLTCYTNRMSASLVPPAGNLVRHFLLCSCGTSPAYAIHEGKVWVGTGMKNINRRVTQDDVSVLRLIPFQVAFCPITLPSQQHPPQKTYITAVL